MHDKISLVTFTDPMMGLSYECEPILRKIETHFAGKIEFHFVMSGLVRNVYELITPNEFLYRLRYAMIVDCRPTTKLAEILKVVVKTGIDHKKFLSAYNDGSAEKNFQSDLQTCRRLGIHSLPSYLIQYKSDGALIQNLAIYETFAKVFDELSGGLIKPVLPEKNLETLRKLLKNHPLISPIELREAFDFDDIASVKKFIAPLIDSGEIKIIDVPRGWFIELEV